MLSPSIVIPSRGRPDMLCDTVCRLFDVTPGVEIVVVADDDDKATIEMMSDMDLTLVITKPLGYVMPLWNLGLQHTHNEWVQASSDDLLYGEGWFEKAIAHNIGGYVGLNDLHTRSVGSFAPCWMVTRRFILDVLGGCICIPHYKSWCNEVEIARRAHRAGVYVWAEDAIVEHRHYIWGNMTHDITHVRGEQWHREDFAMLDARTKAGFPNDYPPAIS